MLITALIYADSLSITIFSENFKSRGWSLQNIETMLL